MPATAAVPAGAASTNSSMRLFRSVLVGLVSLGMFLVAIREAYNIRLYAIKVRRAPRDPPSL